MLVKILADNFYRQVRYCKNVVTHSLLVWHGSTICMVRTVDLQVTDFICHAATLGKSFTHSVPQTE